MDKEPIDIIDKFFAAHPAQLKPIHSKRSHLKKVEKSNNNSDRSLPLRKSNKNADRADFNSNKAQSKSNVLRFDKQHKKVQLIPRNMAQEAYVDHLMDYEKRIVFAVGPAGTGKTLLAVMYAIQCLKNGEVDRIVITRPAVTVDEDLGALPGTLIEKMAPFVRPIVDVFEEYYSRAEVANLLETGIVEICPFAFIRGRTFKNAIVIIDESQSTSPSQLKAALTRIGEGSKMIVTGDLRQADGNRNGLLDFLDKYDNYEEVAGIAISKFGHKDIERDPIISSILGIYGDTD